MNRRGRKIIFMVLNNEVGSIILKFYFLLVNVGVLVIILVVGNVMR